MLQVQSPIRQDFNATLCHIPVSYVGHKLRHFIGISPFLVSNPCDGDIYVTLPGALTIQPPSRDCLLCCSVIWRSVCTVRRYKAIKIGSLITLRKFKMSKNTNTSNSNKINSSNSNHNKVPTAATAIASAPTSTTATTEASRVTAKTKSQHQQEKRQQQQKQR